MMKMTRFDIFSREENVTGQNKRQKHQASKQKPKDRVLQVAKSS
jgi:hypothetical protein